ncbi:MAG: glutamate--tRNA ligase [Dehalococcoidia bacterium]
MNVRTRYAPSPTGTPHLANMRVALFDWLLARRNGGAFILRIEDTDQNRLVEGAVDEQIEALTWLGLDWDEGPDKGGPFTPYVQSQRLNLYQDAAQRLLTEDKAYPCFCTAERLDQLRARQTAAKQAPGYDRLCRWLTPADRQQRIAAGEPYVVRFAVPLEGETGFADVIRGEVVVQNSTLDDFVILKSDGYPTYHLASVVDDHHMQISHVIRGEEWIPSAPRHQLLHQALGIGPPFFVHLPLILGPDRRKLGKRHGAAGVLEYRQGGYLPEALINFIALLGWSLDDRTEVIDRSTMLETFTLERLSPNPGIFDPDKLRWMNGEWIRRLDEDDLAQRILPYLVRELPETADEADPVLVRRIVPLIQTRMEVLTDAYPLTAFFFTQEILVTADDLLGKRFRDEPAAAVMALDTAAKALAGLAAWTHTEIEGLMRALTEELGLKPRDFFGLVRMAVTGAAVSPPLFESLEILGREKTLERLARARMVLE